MALALHCVPSQGARGEHAVAGAHRDRVRGVVEVRDVLHVRLEDARGDRAVGEPGAVELEGWMGLTGEGR